MKKFSKILIVALTLAVLLCSAFAISASAEETDGAVVASEDGGKWVISKNVSYSENIHLLLAIDANKVEDPELLSVKISVPGVDAACEEFLRCEFKEDLYGEYDEGAVPAYIIHTLGVAAKDMADELTIEIVYNGATVETTTYSVAEYFFERLYKDEFILATDGEALNKKELYLASLKYGNAAQKLLSAADALYIEDAIYVGGVDGVAPLYNPDNILTLPDGYYNVKSYVNGEFVNSTVEGGDYIVEDSAVISEIEVNYNVPDDAYDFEVEEDYDFGFSGAGSKDLGVAAGAISKVYYRQNSSATTLSVVTKNDANGDYLAINKSVAGGQQTWMNIVVDTDANAERTSFVFEAKMRLNIPNYGSGYRIRMYSGSRTSSGGGTEFSDAGMVIKSGFEFGKYSGWSGDSSRAQLGITADEWFTIRIAVSDYVEGENNYVVSILNEDTMQFDVKYENSISTLTDVSSISCICFMDSSDTVYTADFQYMYIGDEPAPVEKPAPTVGTETDDWHLVNNSNTTAGLYDMTVAKNILTNEIRYDVNKYLTGNQVVLRYVRDELYTGTNNTTVFQAKMCFSNLSNGTAWSNGEIDISFGNESGTRMFRSYIIKDGNILKFKLHSTAGAYKATSVEVGEWFDLKIVYTAEGGAYDATKFKVSAYINGELFQETTSQWGSVYADGCDIGRVSILMNGSVTTNMKVEGVSITTTNIPFATESVE